jgi:Ras-related protein Rab-1A
VDTQSSKSDSGDKHLQGKGRETANHRKGVISQRTSKLAQKYLSEESDNSSDKGSTRSSFSSSSDSVSKEILHQNKKTAQISSKQIEIKTPTQTVDHEVTLSFEPRFPSQAWLQPVKINNSVTASPTTHIFRKLHPISTSHLFDPNACESRDSEEEQRLAGMSLKESLQPEGSSKSGIQETNSEEEMNRNTSNRSHRSDQHSPLKNQHSSGRNNVIQLKVVLVGNEMVGKTNLLLKYFDNKYSEHYNPSFGVDQRSQRIFIQGQECRLQVWDTAGNIGSREIMNSYYRGAHCFGLVFDLTNYETIESIPQWVMHIQEQLTESIPFVLIGNKDDFIDDRVVTKESVEQYAIECGLQGYIETSAKENNNLEQMMQILSQNAFEYVKFGGLPLASPKSTESTLTISAVNATDATAETTTNYRALLRKQSSLRSLHSPLPQRRKLKEGEERPTTTTSTMLKRVFFPSDFSLDNLNTKEESPIIKNGTSINQPKMEKIYIDTNLERNPAHLISKHNNITPTARENSITDVVVTRTDSNTSQQTACCILS